MMMEIRFVFARSFLKMVTAAVAAVTLNKPFDNNIYFGMITYTTISYNDIYDRPKPELADLLAGISSKIIVGVMAMLNGN